MNPDHTDPKSDRSAAGDAPCEKRLKRRPLGLFAGAITMDETFDDPLPESIAAAFRGKCKCGGLQ